MDYLLTILLGIIQGLTEFLPISSTGFLIVVEQILRIQESTELMNIALHVGTLAAILLAMQKDVARLCREAFRMIRDIFLNIRITFRSIRNHEEPRYIHIVTSNYRQLVILVITATAATSLVAVLLKKVALAASGSVLYSGIGMLITGILLLVTDMVPVGNKIPLDISWKYGIVIGCVQGLSVIPGISRTGLVFVCGILLGFNKSLSIRFSYLLSIPAVIGAIALQSVNIPTLIASPRYAGTCFVGALCAAVTGMLIVRPVSKLIRQRRLKTFAIWSFISGGVILILSFIV